MPTSENKDLEEPLITNGDQNHAPESYGATFQRISKLSWQMSASYTFSMQMAILVYLLSQLDDSEDNLAAITLITSMINSIVCVGVSPLLAMSLVASKELGELRDAEHQGASGEERWKRLDHIAGVFGNGLIASAVVSPFMMAPMIFAKPLLTQVFNQNDTVASIAAQFITLYTIAIPAIMVRVSADQVMFAFERTKAAMLISLTNFALCMSLGSILAFGKLGSPQYGVHGILIGCILDSYLTAIGYSLYLAKSPDLQDYHFFNFPKSWQKNLDQLTAIKNIGSSIALTMTSETSMNIAINALAGMIGVQEQAALSAIMQFSLFSLLLQIAFGQTCSQEMSREIGNNYFPHASRTGKVGLIALQAYILPVLVILAVYPNILVDIIGSNDPSLIHLLEYLAPILFVGCALDAERFVMLQQMRALGDNTASSLISSSCVGLGIVLSAVLGLKTTMGIYGVATGFTASAGLATLLLLPRWLKRIEPAAIEKNKNNPEQFSISCGGLFRRKQPQVLLLDSKTPISTSLSYSMNGSESA